MATPAHPCLLATHESADLDGYASLVALRHMYPGAALLIPATLQTIVSEVIKHDPPPMPVVTPSQVVAGQVRQLVLADTQDLNRVGAWTEQLPPHAEIHVFDHHPLHAGLAARGHTTLFIEPVGATSTLVTEHLIKAGKTLGADDATLLLAGLYEDTGQLSFLSTTPRDFAAAHQLALWGAQPAEAGDLLQRLWDHRQTEVFHELEETRRLVSWGALRTVVARVQLPFFVPDISLLGGRLAPDDADALFILAGVGQKVFIIARATRAGVDVGQPLRALGGGGHPEAASATLKGVTLLEAEEQLVRALNASAAPARSAEALMSRPPIGILATEKITTAHELLGRHHIGTLIVFSDDPTPGLLDAATVSAALRHGLGGEAVGPYARRALHRVVPSTPLAELRALLFRTGERVFLVESGQALIGVVTRRDILRAVYEEGLVSPGIPSAPGTVSRRSLANEIQSQMGPAAEAHLREIGRLSAALGLEAFLVGGSVRDVLMRKKPVDWDVVVVGDLKKLIDALRRAGVKAKVHGRFNTAQVLFQDGARVDLASARRESYGRPGALPDVLPAGIEHDLFRRDFSINAMALSLGERHYGRLIDRFRGLEDLKHKRIRVLHGLSFIDDPTRAFRAVRLAVRFSFELEEQTVRLLERAVALRVFADSEGTRLRREMLLAFYEPEPLAVLRAFEAHGLLQACLADYQLDPAEPWIRSALEWVAWYRVQFGEPPKHIDTFLLGSLALHAPAARAGDILAAFKLPPSEIELWHDLRERARRLESNLYSISDPRPSQWVECLDDASPLVLLTWAVLNPERRHGITSYLTEWRQVKPAISGEDLQSLNIKPGPEMGKWLTFVRNHVLDGQLPPERLAQLVAVRQALGQPITGTP